MKYIITRDQLGHMEELALWAQRELRNTTLSYPMTGDRILAVAREWGAERSPAGWEAMVLELDTFSTRAVHDWATAYTNRVGGDTMVRTVRWVMSRPDRTEVTREWEANSRVVEQAHAFGMELSLSERIKVGQYERNRGDVGAMTVRGLVDRAVDFLGA